MQGFCSFHWNLLTQTGDGTKYVLINFQEQATGSDLSHSDLEVRVSSGSHTCWHSPWLFVCTRESVTAPQWPETAWHLHAHTGTMTRTRQIADLLLWQKILRPEEKLNKQNFPQNREYERTNIWEHRVIKFSGNEPAIPCSSE